MSPFQTTVDPMSQSTAHGLSCSPTAAIKTRGTTPSPFDAVVFAGGGCRCMWQAGFWTTAAPALGIAPRLVAGVSAGAAFAVAALTDRIESVVEGFTRRAEANTRNFYPANLLRGAPVFPHERIYRDTIEDSLDAETFAKLKAGPELRVLLARLPRALGPRSGVSAAVVAHLMNRRARLVHAQWGTRFRFQPEIVSVQSCETPAEVAELILHSSCAPPLLPLYRRGQRVVLDGGLLDNVPTALVEQARSTLVLLTWRFAESKIPRDPRHVYVMPSRDLSILEFDYTNPTAVRETFDLGRRDGETFARGFVDSGLGSSEGLGQGQPWHGSEIPTAG